MCINLDRRPDRWQRVCEDFARHGITGVERFAAVDGNEVDVPCHWTRSAGAYGCLRSHLAVVEQARAAAWPAVLLFEDDVEIPPDFADTFARFWEQLPSDWDILLFGGIHLAPPEQVSANVYRTVRMLATHAYAVRDTAYDAFVAVNRSANGPVDQNNALLQSRLRCYCSRPYLVWQRDGWSDINGLEQMNWATRDFFVWTDEAIARIAARTCFVVADGPSRGAVLDFYRRHFPGLALEEIAREDKDYVVVSEAGVLPAGEHDVAANLLMLEQYDGVGFYEKDRFTEGLYGVSRRAVERAGGWQPLLELLDRAWQGEQVGFRVWRPPFRVVSPGG